MDAVIREMLRQLLEWAAWGALLGALFGVFVLFPLAVALGKLLRWLDSRARQP